MVKGFFEQLPHRKAFRSPSCLTIDDDCCNFKIDIIKKQKDSGGRHQAAFICQHGEQGHSYDLIKYFKVKQRQPIWKGCLQPRLYRIFHAPYPLRILL